MARRSDSGKIGALPALINYPGDNFSVRQWFFIRMLAKNRLGWPRVFWLLFGDPKSDIRKNYNETVFLPKGDGSARNKVF